MPSFITGDTEALAGKVTCPKRLVVLCYSRKKEQDERLVCTVPGNAFLPPAQLLGQPSVQVAVPSDTHFPGNSTLLGTKLV